MTLGPSSRFCFRPFKHILLKFCICVLFYEMSQCWKFQPPSSIGSKVMAFEKSNEIHLGLVLNCEIVVNRANWMYIIENWLFSRFVVKPDLAAIFHTNYRLSKYVCICKWPHFWNGLPKVRIFIKNAFFAAILPKWATV